MTTRRPLFLLPPTLLLLAFLFPLATPAAGKQWEGKVVKVSDGDTITVLTAERKQVKIRLHAIDAPEKVQDFGQRSRRALGDLVAGKTVTVRQEDVDRYGRVVGTVYVGSTNVNATQVSNGLAWVYRQYAPKNSPLYKLEAEAKAAKRGLWSHPNPVPPWEFRASKRRGARKSAAGVAPVADERCGEKRYCGQMSSCSEAMLYLNVCGVGTLDGDGDGVPCEALCE